MSNDKILKGIQQLEQYNISELNNAELDDISRRVKSMKSVAELAEELDVTPQAIYKRLNGRLKSRLKKHTKKSKGKTLINSQGQAIIRDSFDLRVETEFKRVESPVESPSSPINSVLIDQLQTKDEQIKQLMKQNESLLEKIENMQVLLRHEQEKNLLLIEQHGENDTRNSKTADEPASEKTLSWWERFITK